MTPQDKANNLVEKMYFSRRYKDGEDYIPEQALIHAKQCALIAVDEILDVDCFDMSEEPFDNHIEYWQEVKQEIQAL